MIQALLQPGPYQVYIASAVAITLIALATLIGAGLRRSAHWKRQAGEDGA